MQALALMIALAIAAQTEPPNPATGRPKTVRLAVLPILLQGEHGAATISSVYNDVVSATEMRIGLRVISYEEMFAASEEGLGDRVRDCGSDIGCISARLRTFNARLGFVVVVDLASKPPLVSLQLLDTDDGKMLASFAGEVDMKRPISETIQRRTKETLEKAGYGLAGRVLVEVDPPSAHVVLGDGIDPDQGTPNHFTVAPGKYQVAAALDGWSAAHTDVEVGSGGEAKVQLALTKNTTLLESWWFWTIVGAVVVGGAVTTYALTRRTETCICTAVHGMCAPGACQ
jgi:hypothetical protein